MKNNLTSLIPRNLMFRYRLPCRRTSEPWKPKFELASEHRIDTFGLFEGLADYADIRAGWSEQGLFFTVQVKPRKRSLWCKPTQMLESDGVQVWIDTRATHNVHRATRFCHWFAAIPSGGGPRKDQPVASMLKINRSREDSPTLNRGNLKVASQVSKSGYRIELMIEASCLNGWDPAEHRQLGFNIAIVDRELGWQTLGVGPEFPLAEDPSLWHTLELQS